MKLHKATTPLQAASNKMFCNPIHGGTFLHTRVRDRHIEELQNPKFFPPRFQRLIKAQKRPQTTPSDLKNSRWKEDWWKPMANYLTERQLRHDARESWQIFLCFCKTLWMFCSVCVSVSVLLNFRSRDEVPCRRDLRIRTWVLSLLVKNVIYVYNLSVLFMKFLRYSMVFDLALSFL